MGITYDYQFHSILCWLLGINKGVTMKTIDVKSMLIGFLLCACFFLTIGATDEDIQYQQKKGYRPIGQFQASSVFVRGGAYDDDDYVLITVIDTQSGFIVGRDKNHYSSYR